MERTKMTTEKLAGRTAIVTGAGNGIGRASETMRHLDWFEVVEVRGHITDGQPDHFQVSMKVGFRLEDA